MNARKRKFKAGQTFFGLLLCLFLFATIASCTNINTSIDAIEPLSNHQLAASNPSPKVIKHDEWVYFVGTSPEKVGLFRMKHDESSCIHLLEEKYIYPMFLHNDWIFYSIDPPLGPEGPYGPGGFFKIKTDGTDKQKINDDANIMGIIVQDEWIYYSTGNNLIKMKTDGSGKVHLDEDALDLQIFNNWIYYTKYNKRGIYKIRTNGSEKTRVCSIQPMYFVVVGDWIFYQSDHYLSRIKTDGTQQSNILKIQSFSLEFDDGWLYFANVDDDGKLYKVKTDGSSLKKVSDNNSMLGCTILGDWVYYYNEGFLYRVKKDGTEDGKFEYINLCSAKE
jgi:hypothetical protein